MRVNRAKPIPKDTTNPQPRVNDPPERRKRLTTKARRAQRRTKEEEEKEENDQGDPTSSPVFSLFPSPCIPSCVLVTFVPWWLIF
jgi:hypothetical protein